MISAPKELYLYNVTMTSENYFEALIMYADEYNLSSVYIDGCTLTNTNYHYPGSGIRVINMYKSAGDITILNSELTASSTYNDDGYTSNYVRAIDLKNGAGKVTIENSEITASSASTMSAYGIYTGESYNEEVRNGFTMKNTAVSVTGKGNCYGCVIKDKYNNADDEDKTSITIENTVPSP
jgi:hypothetical protein